MLPKVTWLSHPTTAGRHVGWVHQQERHKDMTYSQLHVCLEFRGGCKGVFPTSFKLPFMGPLVFFFVLSPSLHLLHSPRFPAISQYTLSLKTVSFFFEPASLICSGSSEYLSSDWVPVNSRTSLLLPQRTNDALLC